MLTAPPRLPPSTSAHSFLTRSILTKFDPSCEMDHPIPSPQAWLANSKRRSMPSLLDPPESPLDLLLPITRELDETQWNKRLSLLTHRYLREDEIAGDDQLMLKAWETLEMFCVCEEARRSLQKFGTTFFDLSRRSRPLQTQSLTIERPPYWLSFPNFIDESFNRSHTDLSLFSFSSSMDTLTNDSITWTGRQSRPQGVAARGPADGSRGSRDDDRRPGDQDVGINPAYLTPTTSSRARISSETRIPPPPSTANTGKRKAWMTSAAKRVGIVPSTPRSKKEGRIYKRISPRKGIAGRTKDGSPYQHPNQPFNPAGSAGAPNAKGTLPVHTESSHKNVQSRLPFPAEVVHRATPQEKRSPPDKPLPSLPIATTQAASPIVRRSLIDASEQPMRRSSSLSLYTNVEKDWPTLLPFRPTSPRTIQGMVRDGSLRQANSLSDKVSDRTSDISDRGQKGTILDQGVNITMGVTEKSSQPDAENVESVTRQDPQQVRSSSGFNGSGLGGSTESQSVLRTRDSSVSAADEQSLIVPACVESCPRGRSTMEQGLQCEADPSCILANRNDTMTPLAQRHLNQREKSVVRPSRLPMRRSATGPVRSSTSTRRSSYGSSSPYISVSAPLSGGAGTRKAQPFKKYGHLAKPTQTKYTDDLASVTRQQDSFEATLKQSSHRARLRDSKSLIPRPRRHSQAGQYAENENGVFRSRLANQLGVHTPKSNREVEDKRIAVRAQGGRALSADLADRSTKCDQLAEAFRGGATPFKSGNEDVVPGEVFEPAYSAPIDQPASESEFCATVGDGKDSSDSGIDDNVRVDPYFDTARQRQIIDKPLNRVKRLSATAPQHGPVLRISNAAEKFIMGSGSEVSGQQLITRKRNSVPDLRQSIGVKELHKSKEGLLSGLPPLSRSPTTRSLNTLDFNDAANNMATLEISATPRTEGCAFRHRRSQGGEDPFATPDRKMGAATEGNPTHDISSEISPDDNWPLKPSHPAAGGLCPVVEEAAEGGSPWISPLPGAACELSPARKSNSPVNLCRGNHFEPRASAPPASTEVQAQVYQHTSPPNVSSRVVERKPVPSSTSNTSSTPYNLRFPPRTSSRALTPDVSPLARAQVNQSSSTDIPNRFETVRQRRVPGESSSPTNPSLRPETIHHPTETPNAKDAVTPMDQHTSRTHLSSAKGMLSSFKGLFHKRPTRNPASSTVRRKTAAPSGRRATVGLNGSPYPNRHSGALPTTSASTKSVYGGGQGAPAPRDERLPSRLQDSDLLCHATDLAIQYLNAARVEVDETKRARLLQLGEFMVEAVTSARDAERAMEEAQQAAAKAEVYCIKARKNIGEMTRLIGRVSQYDAPSG